MWRAINTQKELDELEETVCPSDAEVLEYLGTSANSPGLPYDVCRSGYNHPNVYVLMERGMGSPGELLELALIHCDGIGAQAFERFHIDGHIDALKRVDVTNADGSRVFRCARMAYRLVVRDASATGYYGSGAAT